MGAAKRLQDSGANFAFLPFKGFIHEAGVRERELKSKITQWSCGLYDTIIQEGDIERRAELGEKVMVLVLNMWNCRSW